MVTPFLEISNQVTVVESRSFDRLSSGPTPQQNPKFCSDLCTSMRHLPQWFRKINTRSIWSDVRLGCIAVVETQSVGNLDGVDASKLTFRAILRL